MDGFIHFNIAFAAFCFVISVIILVSVALSEHGKEKHAQIQTHAGLIYRLNR